MEEKDVQRLLDMLYGMIDEAKSVAFSSDKCIIVRDEALDLLDEIRAKLPLELKKAQELIAARSEYVAGAKKEAQEVLRQAELDARTYEVQAGGGAVTVTINGKKEVLSIDIKPEIVDPEDIETLSDILVAGINEAIKRVEDTNTAEMEKITGGLAMPGLF